MGRLNVLACFGNLSQYDLILRIWSRAAFQLRFRRRCHAILYSASATYTSTATSHTAVTDESPVLLSLATCTHVSWSHGLTNTTEQGSRDVPPMGAHLWKLTWSCTSRPPRSFQHSLAQHHTRKDQHHTRKDALAARVRAARQLLLFSTGICRVLVQCDRYQLLFKKKKKRNRGLLAQLTGPDSASACPSSNVLLRARMGKMGETTCGHLPRPFLGPVAIPCFPILLIALPPARTHTHADAQTHTHARTRLSAKTRFVTQEKVPIVIPHRDPIPAPSPSLRCCLFVRMRAS
jgi:hypothetical protein